MFLDIAQAFFPSINPDAAAAALRVETRALRTHLPRRITAAALLTIMLGGTIPARSQAPTITFDISGYIQKAGQFLKEELNFSTSEITKYTYALEEMAAQYQQFVLARNQFKRLDGSVTGSVVLSLPILPVQIQAHGKYGSLVLRPVVTPPGAPDTSMNGLLSNLSGYDNTTGRTPTTDTNKQPDQIAKDATTDGWTIWRQAQSASQIDQAYMDLPDANGQFQEDPYFDFRQAMAARYQMRIQELTAASVEIASDYGDDDPAVAELQALAASLQADTAQTADLGDIGLADDRLNQISKRADELVEKAGYWRTELGLQNQRDAAKDQNLEALDQEPNTPDPGLATFISGGAIGGIPTSQNRRDTTKSRQQGASTAETLSQQYRANLRKELDAVLTEMSHLAAEKATEINKDLNAQDQLVAAAKFAAIKSKIDTTSTAYAYGDFLALMKAASLPVGAVPATLTQYLPGATTATPEAAISANLDAAHTQGLTAVSGILNDWLSNFSSINPGILGPVAAGFDAASKSVMGRAFGLSDWSWVKGDSNT